MSLQLVGRRTELAGPFPRREAQRLPDVEDHALLGLGKVLIRDDHPDQIDQHGHA